MCLNLSKYSTHGIIKENIMETIITIFLILGLVLAFVWWLWVMNTICKTIEHRGEQKAILENLVEDVQELKKLLREIR